MRAFSARGGLQLTFLDILDAIHDFMSERGFAEAIGPKLTVVVVGKR